MEHVVASLADTELVRLPERLSRYQASASVAVDLTAQTYGAIRSQLSCAHDLIIASTYDNDAFVGTW